MHQNKHQNKQHEPVLLAEVLQYLDPQSGELYLDLTAGYGGHAAAVLERIGSLTQAVLVDRDNDAIAALQTRFGRRVETRQSDFMTVSRELAAEGRRFDLILADLGTSSPHLNEPDRGFSISRPGPLDMRMDRSQALTAADIVNGYGEAELAEVISRYGEDPKARRIARAIVARRPVASTDQLAAIVAAQWPGRARVHPATRTFQALRIAVNDELGQLAGSLPLWIELLAPGGRLAVISFHSLEDRLVKQTMRDHGGNRYDAELRLLTKRPVRPGSSETVHNPRARSAKLRAAVKINKKGN
jgi:16S rRNA (cytosine1402-N4)-methyltransferase